MVSHNKFATLAATILVAACTAPDQKQGTTPTQSDTRSEGSSVLENSGESSERGMVELASYERADLPEGATMNEIAVAGALSIQSGCISVTAGNGAKSVLIFPVGTARLLDAGFMELRGTRYKAGDEISFSGTLEQERFAPSGNRDVPLPSGCSGDSYLYVT